VQSHRLLNRPDLPAFSNWLGLLTLPIIGSLLAMRVRNYLGGPGTHRVPMHLWAGLAGSLAYGAALAISFSLDASSITWGLFLGLFLLAAVFPIYRAEYALGFVVGMTITFGAVLPTLVAAVFATASLVFRLVIRGVVAAARSLSRDSGAA
jgi:hypothetical protein